MAIEIVDFPMKNGWIFHSYVKLPEGMSAKMTRILDRFMHISLVDWLTGWPTPLKNDVVKVSWDDEIPNWMESHKLHVPNHQPVQYFIIWCCFQLVYRYIISWFIISFPVKLDVNWGQNHLFFGHTLLSECWLLAYQAAVCSHCGWFYTILIG